MNHHTMLMAARAHGWTCAPRRPQMRTNQELRCLDFRFGNIVTVPGQGASRCDAAPQGDGIRQVLNPFVSSGHDLS